jgi:hypothetical protein
LTKAFVSPDVGSHPTTTDHCNNGLTGYFFLKSRLLNPVLIKPKTLEFQAVLVLALHSIQQVFITFKKRGMESLSCHLQEVAVVGSQEWHFMNVHALPLASK